MKKKWSGERLETDIYGDVSVEHLHRYAMSSVLVEDKIVLDIASGEGYGSFLMAKTAKKVIGVDIDTDVVNLAREKYKNDNLDFLVGSTDCIPLESNSVDVLISFETIEHHDKHEEMFLEIKRVLKPNGILIISSPDKQFYSNLQKNNPYHIKELYLEEFEDLSKKHFTNVKTYFQNCINGSSIIAPIILFENLKVFSGTFENIYTKKISALYNIIIASEQFLDDVDLSIFDGQTISKKINEDNINYIRSSTTFKLGSVILKPFIKLKNILLK
ncbi:Methyltransferase domain-containing protein [Flavobacterium segetis]|uniref:Methyltransferase domain-containing protein n=1 Tax=Flavobacterium segetis TaxID=271157 RepID=A0A1M5GT48_9FLAO|nr:class I SAM-dependent methyltransferase [Flavobacterium segetis]SHG06936.1 Methyltransferase domain-containing protein [Flavobacterium segetis]